MKIKPIETKYKGYRFRSRLEARWAVFFETLGCSWEYEPEGFDLNGLYYLPDFKVKYPSGDVYWFEVKSSVKAMTEEEFKKITLFARYVDTIYLLDGTPEFGAYLSFNERYQGLTYQAWDDYSNTTLDLVKGDLFDEDSWEEWDKTRDELLSHLKNKTDTSITSMNIKAFKSKSDYASTEADARFGDVLYTHEDGGRIFYSNEGGDIDSGWEPELTNAITAARSARFEHGENPGRYDDDFKGGGLLGALKRVKGGGNLQ